MTTDKLHARYGPGAVIVGGSEGIGAAVAAILAESGFDLVLVARRPGPLGRQAESLRATFDVTVHTVTADAGDPSTAEVVGEWMIRTTAGLLVYNAASAPVGEFGDLPHSAVDSVVAVNCRGMARTVHTVLPQLVERGLEEGVRGGIILMSSLAGIRGASRIAAYCASKAFTTTFAEALWYELRDRHVDVVACVAGATDTPGFQSTSLRPPGGVMRPGRVARAAVRALGRRPVAIAGVFNRIAAFAVARLLPRKLGIAMLSRHAGDLGRGR